MRFRLIRSCISDSPLLSPLFSQRDGAHAVMNSFPTRRSSDLVEPRGLGGGGDGGGCARTAAAIAPADRKSTRLNSSHVAISYAVFCLEKKREIDTGYPGADETKRLHSCDAAFPYEESDMQPIC